MEIEKAFKIGAGHLRDLFDADAFQFGELSRRSPARKAGSLRLPRCGSGARYGQSVSTSNLSIGTDRATSRKAAAFLNVSTPGERDVKAHLDRVAGKSSEFP